MHLTAKKQWGSVDCSEQERDTVLNRRLRINYVNPLLYPVSAIDCPSPERGVLGIIIGDLTSKIYMLLFTLLIIIPPPVQDREIYPSYPFFKF